MMQKLYKTFNQENDGIKPEAANYFKFYVGYGNNY